MNTPDVTKIYPQGYAEDHVVDELRKAYQKGVEDERARHREFYLAVREYYNYGAIKRNYVNMEIIEKHLTAFTAQEQAELPFGCGDDYPVQ